MARKQKIVSFVAICQILLAAATSSASVDRGSEPPNYPMTLQYVGVADGKSYFVDFNQALSQPEALAYCQASNLKLASVDSKNQVDMLNKALPEMNSVLPQRYWTSARESRTDSMFVWNESGAQLNSSLVADWWMTGGEHYCVVYYILNNTTSGYHVTVCTARFHPLCHT